MDLQSNERPSGPRLPAAAVAPARSLRAGAKRDILSSHPLFAGLSPSDVDRLADYGRLEHLRKGATIFSKGDPGTGLMAVVSGLVKIGVPSPEGKEIVLNIIHPGEVFGEIALLDGRPRTANAVAMADSEVLSLDRREFVPFIRANPDVALSLLAVLCDRLRRTSEQVEDVLFLDLAGRLAKMVLRLGRADPGGAMRVRATQKELGQMIGLSRESTNKQLQLWVARRWVTIEKGGLVVRNAPALQKFAQDSA